MSEKTPETAGRRAGSRLLAFVYASGGLIVYFFALFIYYNGNNAAAIVVEPKWHVGVLFFLPVLAQLVGVAYHVENDKGKHDYFYRFSMRVSFVSTVLYSFFWVMYSSDFRFYSIFSGLALVIVGLLICLVIVIMCAFMQEPNKAHWRRLSDIRTGAANEPLWALLFLFFVIFLNVTFLFGFAFAFHDQQCLTDSKGARPALRMANYDSADDIAPAALVAATNDNAKAREPGSNAAVGSPGPPNEKADAISDKDTDYHFFFKSGEAQLFPPEQKLPKTDEEKVKAEEVKVKEDNAYASLCALPATETGVPSIEPPQRTKWLMEWHSRFSHFERFNARFNRCSLQRIRRRIEAVTANGAQVRVILIGQGDNHPVAENGHYRSNYELSEARVHNVRYEITGTLKTEQDSGAWHNLEWLTLPASDESRQDEVLEKIFSNLDAFDKKHPELTDLNMRVVKALIIPVAGDLTSLQMTQFSRPQFKGLRLMDYMYFSIYTITTTGYGDIIPTTAYAKFVISVANICEVLFLVVFFNALVSIRGDKSKDLIVAAQQIAAACAVSIREDKSKDINIKDNQDPDNEILDMHPR